MRAGWAGLMLAVVAAAGCSTLPFQADKVNVSLSDVRIVKAGVVEQVYALKLRVQNPNAKPLNVAGLAYEVEINGRNFAKGVSPKTVMIPAFGETQFDVEAVSSISTLIEQITRLKIDRPKALRYRLTGHINTHAALRMGVPFEYAGEVPFSALAPPDLGLDQPIHD